MSFSHCNLSFVLLLATVSFPSSALSSSTTDLIDRICKLTPFYDGLGAINVAYFLQNANAMLCKTQGMISRSPPESEQPLAYCAELYIPIVKYSLPHLLEALEKGRHGFTVYGIADAEKGVEGCEKRVEGGGEDPDAVKAWKGRQRTRRRGSGNHQSVIA